MTLLPPRPKTFQFKPRHQTTMNKKPRPRYNDEQEILAEIHQQQRLQNESLKKADELSTSADRLYVWIGNQDADLIRTKGTKLQKEEFSNKFHEAKRCREAAVKLLSKLPAKKSRLERLKQKLAEFRTQPMPFLEDAGIVQ